MLDSFSCYPSRWLRKLRPKAVLISSFSSPSSCKSNDTSDQVIALVVANKTVLLGYPVHYFRRQTHELKLGNHQSTKHLQSYRDTKIQIQIRPAKKQHLSTHGRIFPVIKVCQLSLSWPPGRMGNWVAVCPALILEVDKTYQLILIPVSN